MIWMIQALLLALFGLIHLTVALHVAYLLIYLVVATVRRDVAPPPGPGTRRFALLVPAHNEAAIIGGSLATMRRQHYPPARFDVVVIADNCTDDTAAVARAAGALVFERFDQVRRGKGYALEWVLAHMAREGLWYDAYCIFDADNLVHPDFLSAMDARLEQGAAVLQGAVATKNPSDTWMTHISNIIYLVSNRLEMEARGIMGLSCKLHGTGMCFARNVIEHYGWTARSLTEDREYYAMLALHGISVQWASDAVTYDEKPLTVADSNRQRVRWLRGEVDVTARYALPLILKGLRRGPLWAAEAGLYLLSPSRSLIAVEAMAAGAFWLLTGNRGWFFSWQTVLACLFVLGCYHAWGLVLGGGTAGDWRALLLSPLFIIRSVEVPVRALFDREIWSHTRHHRQVELDSIVAESPGKPEGKLRQG